MVSDDSLPELRYEPADYRVRLYLSVDLSGSTAFKNSSEGESRDEGPTPKWVTVFEDFYNNFPVRFSSNFQDRVSPALGPARCPAIWKAVGDELVFCGRVDNKMAVGEAISAFIKTMVEYRKLLIDSKLNLNLKGAGWLAAFPEPNRAVQLRGIGRDVDYLSASEALERAADERPFEYDFLGKAIDTGFRVASKAQPDRFALSVQLARLLASAPRGTGFDLHIDHPIEMRGVNRGVPYPLLYIETLDHLPIAKIRELERELLFNKSPPTRAKIATYLASYCEMAGTDEILLPLDVNDRDRSTPESYNRHRPLIAAHLEQERGREPKVPNGEDPLDDGGNRELSVTDEMNPLQG